MNLTFSPTASVYDPTLDAVRVLALDGQRLVFCAVGRCALVRLASLPAACSGGSLLAAFKQHADRLLAIAAWKYETGRRDGGGRVLVVAEDFVPSQRAMVAAPALRLAG